MINIFGGYFNKSTTGKKDAQMIYTFIVLLSSLIVWWIMYAINFSFDAKVLPYSVMFGLFLTIGTICNIFALKTGPIVLTSLIVQISTVMVAIWGLIFWNTAFTIKVISGIILVVVSLFLCLYSKKQEEDAKTQKITFKWLVFVMLAFVGNGGCLIVQKSQQMAFNNQHSNMLMAFAMVICIIAGTIALIKSDKVDVKPIVKKGGIFAYLVGVSNVLLNLFVLLLANTTLSPSLIYPTLAVGSLIITTILSIFLFKERLKWWQWIGVAVGMIAVGLLS
jgi:drug/metabolite transporter (DMT)-like permease